MGRRSKHTAEVEQRIFEAIEMGLSYKHAALYAGIGERTFHTWMEENQQFQQAIRAREGKGALALMERIQNASQLDWHAAAWALEHRWPEEYAKNRIEVEHSGGVDVHLALEQLQGALDDAFGEDGAAKRAFTAKMAAIEATGVAGANQRGYR
jgi:hypothetical protein